jgi:probable phosphoglycerate mutase
MPHPILEPDAREWDYGEYEGLTSREIHEKNPTWLLFKQGAPRGESIEDVSKRADRLLKKLKQYTGPIALFSHGHFSRVITARWLGLPAQDGRLFSLSVASLSILGFEKEAPALLLWNDTSHLHPLS